jgi:hypothetical protein
VCISVQLGGIYVLNWVVREWGDLMRGLVLEQRRAG